MATEKPASLIYVCFDCEARISTGIFCFSCREHRLSCDEPKRFGEGWCHGAGPYGVDTARLERVPEQRLANFQPPERVKPAAVIYEPLEEVSTTRIEKLTEAVRAIFRKRAA